MIDEMEKELLNIMGAFKKNLKSYPAEDEFKDEILKFYMIFLAESINMGNDYLEQSEDFESCSESNEK